MSSPPTHGFTRFEAALPELCLTNDDPPFSGHEKTVRRTGITARHIARGNETVESLAIRALEEMPEHTRMCTALVLSTTAADHDDTVRPEDAARRIADHFRIPIAHAVNMACSGFSAAVAKAMTLSREHSDIAVVCSEVASRGLDYGNPGTFLLFGDAAAATTISRGGPHLIEAARVEQTEDPKHLLDAQYGLFKDFGGTMHARSVFRMTPGTTLTEVAGQSMADSVLSEGDSSALSNALIVPHQASQPVLNQLEHALYHTLGKSPAIARRYGETGNTVSASVPLALAAIQHEIRHGTLVLCPTAGGGEALRPGMMSRGLVRIRW